MYGVTGEKRSIFVESDAFLYNLCDPAILVSTKFHYFEIVPPASPYIKKYLVENVLQGKPKNRRLPFFRLSICKTIQDGRVGQFPIFGYSLYML